MQIRDLILQNLDLLVVPLADDLYLFLCLGKLAL